MRSSFTSVATTCAPHAPHSAETCRVGRSRSSSGSSPEGEMMKQLLAAAAIVLMAGNGAAAAPSLVGLWAARRDFGPDVRGALRLTGGRAEIAGRSAAVKFDHDSVTFALPNGEGRFRGAIRGEHIIGHWIQPPTVSAGREFATPVTLSKTAAGWVGEVRPLDDHMTLFLPIAGNAAFLRNPERNVGRFIDVQRLTLDGSHVTLFGKKDAKLAEGTYDPENDVLSILIPGAGGTFDFHRATAADEAAFYPRGKTPQPY